MKYVQFGCCCFLSAQFRAAEKKLNCKCVDVKLMRYDAMIKCLCDNFRM